MKLYRQKIFFNIADVPGVSPVPSHNMMKKALGESNPLVVRKEMQYQDWRNGDYWKSIKKNFYISKEDLNAWKNGTYKGQRR